MMSHLFAAVKLRRVPPSPPLRQQEGVDGDLHVRDIMNEAAILAFEILSLGQVRICVLYLFNFVVLRPGRC